MASFFRGINIFRQWNNRIHPELDYATSEEGKGMIPRFPADGPPRLNGLPLDQRSHLQVRQDVGGYMASVIYELLDLLKNTDTNFCTDRMYDTLRRNYYSLCSQTIVAERAEMERPTRL